MVHKLNKDILTHLDKYIYNNICYHVFCGKSAPFRHDHIELGFYWSLKSAISAIAKLIKNNDTFQKNDRLLTKFDKLSLKKSETLTIFTNSNSIDPPYYWQFYIKKINIQS